MSIVISEQAQAIFDKIQAMRESTAVTTPQVTAVTDLQLEAWKKQPKDQALKEALELFRSQGMDISEAKFRLEVLKFISELQGAHVPVTNTQNIVAIEIHVADLPPGMKIIETAAVHQEQ